MAMRKRLVAGAACIAGAALAHEGASGVVADRMNAMKAMSGHLKAIGEMLNGRAAFDAESVGRHAEALSENCHKTHEAFPPDSGGHHTRALPAVWERPEAFAEEMQRFHEATTALAEAAGSEQPSTLEPLFAEVGRACASCHETFRQTE